MFKKLFFTKFIVVIVVFVAMISSIVFIGAAVYKSYSGIRSIFSQGINSGEIPLLKVFTSLEYFLIALVFIVFALGISQLFLTNKDRDLIEEIMPKWLRIRSFNDLKFILWETILTTLLVLYMVDLIENSLKITWEVTIVPIVILIFAISLFLLKKGSESDFENT